MKDFQNPLNGVFHNDWKFSSLNDVCIKIQDGNYGELYPKSNEFVSIGIPFLTSKAIGKDGILKDNSIDFISKEKHMILAKAHLALNDVLFTNRGASVGAIGFVDKRISNGNIGPQLTLLRANPDFLEPLYLFQVMKSGFVQNQIVGKDTGSAMNFFGIGSTKKFQIPLPPTKAEQTAIATALNDTDQLITQLEQLIAKKRNIKQGPMQTLLKPKAGWVNTVLGDVAQFYKGKGLSKSAFDQDGNTKCIHYGELFIQHKENIINISNKTNSFEGAFYSKVNDVLMPTSDVTPNGLATASCIHENNVLLGGDILIIRPDRNKLNGTFLSYCITQNKRQIMQLVTGVTVYHIYASDMARFNFSYPNIGEQLSIAQILTDMDTELEALEQKLAKYRMLKQGMMQTLLTGKTRLVKPNTN